MLFFPWISPYIYNTRSRMSHFHRSWPSNGSYTLCFCLHFYFHEHRIAMAINVFSWRAYFLLSPFCHELFVHAGFYSSDVMPSTYCVENSNFFISSTKNWLISKADGMEWIKYEYIFVWIYMKGSSYIWIVVKRLRLCDILQLRS